MDSAALKKEVKIMNRKYKNLVGLILTVALVLGMALLVTSCGGDANKVSEIYITKSDLPRLEYVEGQELDLSKGKLTVVVGGKETKLPLTSEEVSITGYDAEVIGEQTLTVTYKELTTTFTVKVSERAVAENYETKYFVGSEFNPLKGRIRITTDDAKSFVVNMSDATVSLVSFDSSVAGTATVTVLYNNGANAYYCQFDVTVYEQSNIEFTAPKQTKYLSHYAGKPNVSGGYFKVTSSDSTLTANIPITESMIEGFDPSAATLANKETPLEQTVKVNYLGKTFEYKVYITFSGVSEVNYYASTVLSKIDWEAAKTNGLSDEESRAAISAMTEYYGLSVGEKELVSEESVALIGRAAAVAVNSTFLKELETYAKSFQLGTDGNIYFMKSSYEETAADTERLNDPDEKLNVYATLLRQIVTDFGDLSITEGVTVKSFVKVYSADLEAKFKAVLNHLVDVYELIEDIPAQWDKEALKPFESQLVNAVMQIYTAGYHKSGNGGYYTNILSKWRENDDFLDIIYTFFLYDYEDGDEFMRNYMWGYLPMPGLLESWYSGLNLCMSYSNVYKNYVSSNTYLVDVSPYMYNYFHTLEICEQIKSSNNQFWIDIYNVYNGDNMNTVYMYSYSYGYLYHTKGMIDSEAFHTLWEKYYEVLKLYNSKTLSAELNKVEIRAMFDAFEALKPEELRGFLSSLSLMYTSGKGAYPMLGHTAAKEGEDATEMVYSVFAYILSNYYESYLTETNKDLFNELLYAMESFALIGYKDGATAEFNAKMEALSQKISALTGNDKANFEEYFGESYSKYLKLYELSSGKTSVTLTDEETKLIGEYVKTLEKYFAVYGSIYSIIQNGYTVAEEAYPVLYALYARASELRAELLGMMSEEALPTVYTTEYEISGVKYTLENAYYLADSVTTSVLTGVSAIVSNNDGTARYTTYWELYTSDGMQKLLSDAAYVLYYSFFDDGEPVNHADFIAFMTDMRDFDVFKTSIITLLNIDDTFYKAMERYYKANLTEAGAAECGEIIAAARAYTNYTISKTAENLAAFLSSVETLKTGYESISDADKAQLNELYNYYVGLAETLSGADETV